ncbi:MAG: MerR family transcriptional regulator [Acidimicrobiales bacterium]|nr:MerR family transcriptional regulator [Acidimicrobiales bacterium]
MKRRVGLLRRVALEHDRCALDLGSPVDRLALPVTPAEGQLAGDVGVPATTLRYYDKIGLLPPTALQGGQRRYDARAADKVRVIATCQAAGFSLDEIALLYQDRSPGRERSKQLARRKLVEIDAQVERLAHARAVIEWGLRCTCPVLDDCTCGIHPDKP